jgi:hypothetical protein
MGSRSQSPLSTESLIQAYTFVFSSLSFCRLWAMGSRSQSPLSTESLRRLSWKLFFRYRKLPLKTKKRIHKLEIKNRYSFRKFFVHYELNNPTHLLPESLIAMLDHVLYTMYTITPYTIAISCCLLMTVYTMYSITSTHLLLFLLPRGCGSCWSGICLSKCAFVYNMYSITPKLTCCCSCCHVAVAHVGQGSVFCQSVYLCTLCTPKPPHAPVAVLAATWLWFLLVRDLFVKVWMGEGAYASSHLWTKQSIN